MCWPLRWFSTLESLLRNNWILISSTTSFNKHRKVHHRDRKYCEWIITVWPDVGQKGSSIFPKIARNRHNSYWLRSEIFQNILNKLANILASLVGIFIRENFKNSPNLVTLKTSSKLSSRNRRTTALAQQSNKFGIFLCMFFAFL